MNVLLLRRWLTEEGPGLIGARLRGARQLDPKSILLQFATEQGRLELLVSVRADSPVLALWPGRANDAGTFEESSFIKALHHQLAGHSLIAIQQDGFERSVSFRFHQRDSYGRDFLRQLVVELAGRSSNAYLLSERGMVVSILKKIPPGSNRVRRVVTGKPLPSPPPLGKFIAAAASVEELEAELATALDDSQHSQPAADPLRELMTRRVAGGDVRLWPALEALLPVEHSLEGLHSFIRELQAGELTDQLFGLHGPGDCNRAALAAWEAASSGGHRAADSAGAVGGSAAVAAARIEAQLALASRADELEALGLALLAEAGALDAPDGGVQSRLLELQDEHHDWADRIDPLASAADNAQQLINLAQRLRRARETLALKLAEIDNPQSLPNKLAEGRQKAEQASIGSAESAKLERRGVKHLRFISSDGMAILCGTSDAGNDGLLRHFGNARHLWLHARDFPGSHVLILSNGSDISRRTLEEAATIAAYYSKGQKDHEVEVSYVPMKHVRKPKGAKPGLVHISNEKVISVRPDRFEEWRPHLQRRG